MPQAVDLARALPLFGVAATRGTEQAAAVALPPHTLMRRAGLATARLALALAPHARQVWIACGPGNNGGDGLEAAMHLRAWGLNPVVTWLGQPDRAPADALASWKRAVAAGVCFADAPPEALDTQDLYIDALLGIGAARAPSGRLAEWLARLRASPATLLAVDLPSGLDADTGVLAAPATASKNPDLIAAQKIPTPANAHFSSKSRPTGPRHTLSLLTLKPGLFTADGRDACGRLWFDDLGVAADLVAAPPRAWLNPAPISTHRAHASHKGSYGDVAVLGGEGLLARGLGMTGAALLAGSAALHGGAGRVLVALLDGGALAQDTVRPELMLRRPEALALDTLTVVCGCGGGQAVRAWLPAVLAQAPCLVLDADALNALAEAPPAQAALRQRAAAGHGTVLTPHPLEAGRLLATSAAEIQQDRLAAAHALAERFQCAVVLKGSGTVIAAPGMAPRINPTGNARLATAGTGDVLAGLIGARLAAGLPPFEAACAAVFQHGSVADRWAASGALTADQLARALST
ncbi:MAG: NAD(P)H-hydrate dehydratase [Proteobacteria bacterium]|nr:NAD(P)H-hydrate dehydratase [Pseudomonadota bacterium]